MKKISLMFIALVAAVTMSAETVKSDELTSAAFGFNTLKNGYVDKTYTSTEAKVTYAAQANGGVAYLQIRSKNANSGIVSTTSGGYVKSVRILQKDTLTPGQVEIYGSNTAFTAPSDLYSESKSTKVGAVSGLDGTYSFTNNYTYVGVRSSSGARYIDKVIITWTDTKPGTDPGVWTPDTISISEAIGLIDKGDVHSHYIYGVVSEAPFCPAKDVYAVMLSDVEDPTKLLEGYTMRKGKEKTDVYTSLDEMNQHYALNDTVLIYADGISKFKTTYQTNSGYYVKTIGKSSAINGNEIFKYGFGAIQKGQTDKGLYKYEFVLSKKDPQTEADAYENALHMIINSQKELGIAGSYTVRNYQSDSSYVDGEGPAEGSLKITYVEETSSYNKYSIKSDFTLGGKTYRIDSVYEIPGYDSLFEETFKLVDDVPYKPKPGDTLTCAQAAEYAASLGSAAGDTVYVRGFVTGCQKSDYDRRAQQSPYMADDATATKGVFQAYMGYTQNRDSIVKGDEIIVYGPVSYYSSKGQIKNGQIYRVGGSSTQRPIVKDNLPEDAITVAAALEIAAKLGEKDTSEVVTIKGYVTKLYKTFNGQYSSQSFYMDDKPYEEGAMYSLEAFQSKIAVSAIVGDFVFVKGRIAPYVKESTTTYNIVNSETKFTEVPTGFEEIKSAAKKMGAQKVMMNGQMFIMKDGVLYNALGSKVQ